MHFCEATFFVRKDPKVSKRKIKMGEIEGNWQPGKIYCSEIKLIYSTSFFALLNLSET